MAGAKSNDIDWNTIYGTVAWYEWFKAECERKLGPIADDTDNIVQDALVVLFGKKLPKARIKHRDNLDAFVKVIYRNILEDQRRKLSGRPRAPTEMKRLGPPIVDIFFLYCIHQMVSAVIAEDLQMQIEEVDHWIKWLRAGKRCPKKTITSSLTRTNGDGGKSDGTQFAVEDCDLGPKQIIENELVSILEAVFGLGAVTPGADSVSRPVQEALDQIRSGLNLSDDDRLLIRMVFVENLSFPKIAGILGEKPHTLRRHLKRRLDELREIFEANGLTGEALLGGEM